MCAFFLPAIGELILEGAGAAIATNMTNEVFNQFKPIVARKVGEEVGDYAKNHPKGFIAQSLDSAAKTRYKSNENSNKSKMKEKILTEEKRLRDYTKEQHRRYEHSYRKGHRTSKH
jgi:hypothetical protein